MTTVRCLGLLARLTPLAGLLGCRPDYDAMVRKTLDAHDLPAARATLDDEIADTRVPADRVGLALLERASLDLAASDAKAGLADVVQADARLGQADLESARSSVHKHTPKGIVKWERNGILRYLGKPLVLTPHERLFENLLGMQASWALGDDSALRVEARRFALVRTELHGYAIAESSYRIMAAGGLLAAWAFENEDRNEACLYAKEAARSVSTPLLAREEARLCGQGAPPSSDPPKTTGVGNSIRGLVSVGRAPQKDVVQGPPDGKNCFKLFEVAPPAEPVVTVDGVVVPAELLVDLASYTFDFWNAAVARVGGCTGIIPAHWVQTAPARIYAFDVPVALGAHTVRIESGGEVRERTVEVTARTIPRVVAVMPFSMAMPVGTLRSIVTTPPPPPTGR